MFGPHPDPDVRILSLGAGVQSSTMALMAAHGEFGDMPDAAIFADTGAEPAPVYEHLEWLASDNVLPFPIHVVSGGNIYEDLMAGTNSTGQDWTPIPMFLKRPDGAREFAWKRGQGRRQCTNEYKLQPLMRAIRDVVLGPRGLTSPSGRVRKGVVAESWIGISTDEAARMKPSRWSWQHNRWPLVERGMSRGDCLLWLRNHGYPPPPKSACTFCPFMTKEERRWLRDNDPAGHKQAIEVDEALREQAARGAYKGVPYLHSSLQPLRELDLSTDEERGQGSLWVSECEGVCGI